MACHTHHIAEETLVWFRIVSFDMQIIIYSIHRTHIILYFCKYLNKNNTSHNHVCYRVRIWFQCVKTAMKTISTLCIADISIFEILSVFKQVAQSRGGERGEG